MASRHPSKRFYNKQVAKQYQYGTKIFVGQKEAGKKTSLVEAFVHSDTGATQLVVFSGKGLQPQTHCISSKFLTDDTMRGGGRLLLLVQEHTPQ